MAGPFGLTGAERREGIARAEIDARIKAALIDAASRRYAVDAESKLGMADLDLRRDAMDREESWRERGQSMAQSNASLQNALRMADEEAARARALNESLRNRNPESRILDQIDSASAMHASESGMVNPGAYTSLAKLQSLLSMAGAPSLVGGRR